MNILHIVQLYHPVASGAARYFVEIAERLVHEGHRVTVLTTDAYDLEHFWARGKRRIEQPTELYRGARIVRFPVRRLPGPALCYPIIRRLMVECSRLPRSTALLRRLAVLTPQLPDLRPYLRACASVQPRPFDIIHTTNITLDFAIIPAFDFAQQYAIPFICTPFVHVGEPGTRAIVRYYSMRHHIDLLRRSDRVIVQTGIEGAYLNQCGVPDSRLRRIGVGVTPTELAGGDGAQFRATQRIDGPLVLVIGALAFDKGTIHVIDAMRQLWNNGSHATLVLMGAPLSHFTHAYERLPDAVRAHIRLLPYATDAVKRDALAAADLLALPSRTDSFGIVYLEAWCYAVPVIGARAGGVPDVIDDGENGLLVSFGDVAALAQAINTLIADPARARRLGEAGRAKVFRELTWEHKYAQVRAVYHEVAREEAAWCSRLS